MREKVNITFLQRRYEMIEREDELATSKKNMKTSSAILCAALFLTVASGLTRGQDLSGTWQGTLKDGSEQLRIVVHISAGTGGGWTGSLYSIDQGSEAIPITGLSVQNSTIKFTVEAVRSSYEGTLSGNGASIAGKWKQGKPLPLALERASGASEWPLDASPHTVHFITVDKDVKLEVLDWRGSGRPVLLLAGLGNDAHVFDRFAPKLATNYHVYGISRRGFGVSSAPTPDAENYTADRLANDVLAVCDSLTLAKPVLIGHSIAGEELSSIGTRHPEKVSGLVYLDAGYAYAFYDVARGDIEIDAAVLKRKLQQWRPDLERKLEEPLDEDLLQETVRFETDLRERKQELQSTLEEPSDSEPPAQNLAVLRAILAGEQRFAAIKPPLLAIYAVQKNFANEFKDKRAAAAAQAVDTKETNAQAEALQKSIPSARVVRIPHATHFVFLSNEAQVLREIQAFIGTLPQ